VDVDRRRENDGNVVSLKNAFILCLIEGNGLHAIDFISIDQDQTPENCSLFNIKKLRA
jgi:hypothetical protein